MSVIINGMHMPDSCYDCPICYDNYMCGIIQQNYFSTEDFDPIVERLPGCPLIAIPKPHGRLIDADALADDLEWDAQHFEDDHELKFNAAMWLRSNQNKVYLEGEV